MMMMCEHAVTQGNNCLSCGIRLNPDAQLVEQRQRAAVMLMLQDKEFGWSYEIKRWKQEILEHHI